jgi:hypothetical protein
MLQQMQMSGATSAQMTNAMNMMQNKLQHNQYNGSHVEDNVDSLLAKLEGHGKKIKIMTEEEQELEKKKQ